MSDAKTPGADDGACTVEDLRAAIRRIASYDHRDNRIVSRFYETEDLAAPEALGPRVARFCFRQDAVVDFDRMIEGYEAREKAKGSAP